MEMSQVAGSVKADDEAPAIAVVGGQTAGTNDNRNEQARQDQAIEEWYRLYKLLFQIDFFPPAVTPSPKRLEQTEKTLRQIAQSYPKFKTSANTVIFPARNGSIHAQANRIEFIKPRLKIVGRAKFTRDDALTMARLAGQNENMLAKGIRLTGNEAEQKLLREAINVVNAELPAGMKLTIRDVNEAPVPQPQPTGEPETVGRSVKEIPTNSHDIPRTVEAPQHVKDRSPIEGSFDDDDAQAAASEMSLQEEAAATSQPDNAAEATKDKPESVADVAPTAQEDTAAKAENHVADFADYGTATPVPAPQESDPAQNTVAEAPVKPKRTRRRKGAAAERVVEPATETASAAPSDAALNGEVTATASPTPPPAEGEPEEVIDSSRRSLLMLGSGKDAHVEEPVSDGEIPAREDAPETEAVEQAAELVPARAPRKFTRRLLAFGIFAVAVTLPTPALAEGLLARLGFKKSKTYDRQKAGAGLQNKTLASRPETAKEKRARKLQEAAEKKSGKKPLTEQDKKDIKKWNAAARKVEKETKLARADLKPKVKASEEALKANNERKKGLFGLLFASAATKPVSNDNDKPAVKKGDLTGLFTGKAKKGGVYLYHRHTGETYFLDFSKIETARCQTEMNRFLRDHYSGAVAKMDKRLSYYLRDVAVNLGTDRIDIVSGYRTRNTNINILKNSSAGRSQHCLARAMDIAVRGVSANKLYRAAEKAGCDGIGKYAAKNYVHVDCRGHAARW